jgi:hypothetical protein
MIVSMMKTIFKIMAAVAALPLLWIAFVKIFIMNFKIDLDNFFDDDDI